jgi:hypothetical protein
MVVKSPMRTPAALIGKPGIPRLTSDLMFFLCRTLSTPFA